MKGWGIREVVWSRDNRSVAQFKIEFQIIKMEEFLLQNVIDQIVVWDGDSVHYINESFVQTIGYTRNELIGKSDFSFIRQDDRSSLKAAIWRCNTSHITEKIPVTLLTKNQEQLHSIVQVSPYNQLVCCFFRTAIEDVDQKMREITTATEVKSRFLATMSHEIRTPLFGVMSALSLLSGIPMSEEQRGLLSIGEVCGEQLLMVINDVLDLSKLDENKVELEKEPFNIRQTLEDSLEVVFFDAEKKRLELLLDVDLDVPEIVPGDVRRVRQIVVNLLSNAVKFSTKGEIVLSSSCHEVKNEPDMIDLVIAVADQGIGIAEDNKQKIFGAFTQADVSMSRRYGGTGLGLSISKKLAELMGGAMWFESEENVGSTFYFSMRFPKSSPPPRQEVPPECQGKSILVVNGSEKLLYIVGKQLSRWGFKMQTVLGKKAEEYLTKQKYDLILIDSKEPVELIEKLMLYGEVVIMGFFLLKALPNLPVIKKPFREGHLMACLVNFFQNNKFSISSTPGSNLRRADPTKVGIATSSAQKKTILLAEDNLMNQRIIQRLLQDLGFVHVVPVMNGRDAIQAVRENKIDLVLMDVMMPEIDGIEATTVIRKAVPEDRQPVIIALTADAFQETKEKCLSVGMQSVITKPIRRNVLEQTLYKYLSDVK